MSRSPGSLESLRLDNRRRILGVLQQRGQLSRAEVARTTGLSRTAVSRLVGELVADGVIVEDTDGGQGSPTPNGGRPPTLLTLDPHSGCFVGVQLAHDAVRAMLVDRSGAPLGHADAPLDVDRHPHDALDTCAALAWRLLAQAGLPAQRLLGAGVAISAPLRAGAGGFASSSIFADWAGIDVAQALTDRLGCPVQLGNDANLGALAEATFGAGRGIDNIVYAMLSAGVGAGLVLDGRIFRGHTGTAGELGHVVVDPSGEVCRCGGRGCLETVAGSAALINALGATHGPGLTFAGMLDLVAKHDLPAVRVLTDAGRALGRALAGICSVLDPGMVIVGGELAVAPALLRGVRETLTREASPAAGHDYVVVAGSLGPVAETRGAAVLAMQHAPSDVLRSA